MIWILPHSRQQVVSLPQSSCVSSLLTGGGRGWAETYEREKSWSSINHSILSAQADARRDWPLTASSPVSSHSHIALPPISQSFFSLCWVRGLCIQYSGGKGWWAESYDRKKYEILFLLLFNGLVQREGKRADWFEYPGSYISLVLPRRGGGAKKTRVEGVQIQ